MNGEFEELVQRYLEGTASAEEVRLVDEQIQRDPSARETLFSMAALEVDLRRLLVRPPAVRPLAESERPRPAWRRRFALATLAAVAGWAVALVLLGQYRAKCREHQAALKQWTAMEAAGQASTAAKQSGSSMAVGRLVATQGLVLATPEGQLKAIPVAAESPIPLGGSLWTCPWGSAAIRFADGSSMDLQRSTDVAISQSKTAYRAAIRYGILVVNNFQGSPASAVVVTTAHARVKVVNAQVAVAVQGDRTIVEAAVGGVEVTRISDGRTLTVAANHYVVVEPAAEPKVLDGRLAWQLKPMGK